MNAEKEKMRSMNVATRTRSKGFCVAGTTMGRSYDGGGCASWKKWTVLPLRNGRTLYVVVFFAHEKK